MVSMANNIAEIIEKAHKMGFINRNDKFETECFLKHNKLVHYEGRKRTPSKCGLMFLNSKDPERFVIEMYFKRKYLMTKHKDIFIFVWDYIFENKNFFEEYREHITTTDKLLSTKNYSEKRLKEISEWKEQWEFKLAKKIRSGFSKYNNTHLGNIKRVVGYSQHAGMVGTYLPYFLPYNKAIKIYQDFKNELNDLENNTHKIIAVQKDRVSLYEMYLEAFIRKNFKKIFPKLNVVDNNRQYVTSNNNFIDILAKGTDGYFYVIELKRHKIPQRALTQLLDYMNQVRKDFRTNAVKGILICSEIDRRLESAVEMINQSKDLISLKEFDVSVR